MTQEFVKTLREIETDLYYGIKENGPKSKRAEAIIDFVRQAYEDGLDDTPEDLREFAEITKHHWTELQDLKPEDQKKYLQKQIHGLLEHYPST